MRTRSQSSRLRNNQPQLQHRALHASPTTLKELQPPFSTLPDLGMRRQRAGRPATWFLLLLLWMCLHLVNATPLRGSYRHLQRQQKRRLAMDQSSMDKPAKAPAKAPDKSPTTTPTTPGGLTHGGMVGVVLVVVLVVSLVAVFIYKKIPRRVANGMPAEHRSNKASRQNGESQQNGANASRQNESSARQSEAAQRASQANRASAGPSPWGFHNNLRRADIDAQSDRQSGLDAESVLGMESNMSSYAHTLEDGTFKTGWGAESMLGMESIMSNCMEDGISETMSADLSDTHTAVVPSVIATRMSSMGSESNDDNDDLDIDNSFPPTAASSVLQEIMAPPGKLGLVLDTSDEQPIVHLVTAGSPLEGMIRPGDVIVSIDGIKTIQMSSDDMTQHLTENQFRERKLTVLSGSRA
jgi:cytoskeletal protein RodZ